MFRLQLPPFLLFGIYMTFVYLLFCKKTAGEKDEEKDDEIVQRVKRRIEVKYALYCLLSLFVWIVMIAGIVLLVVRDYAEGKKSLQERWVDPRLREAYVR
jgi:hypothetical protein